MMVSEWHAVAPRRSARLGGFFVHTKDIEQLAQQARMKVLQDPKFLQWAAQTDKAEGRAAPHGSAPGRLAPVMEIGAPSVQDLARMFLDQVPDEGYKLIPWFGREIQRGLLTGGAEEGAQVQWGHAHDIAKQASKWFAWAREHNKPLPQINNRDFGFQDLQDWVYQMNAAGIEGDGWQDSTPVYTWQDGWHMDLVGSKDLAKEGELMGHCVGGYCDMVDNGSSSIFSLRDPNGQPHVTIEVQGRFNGTDPPDAPQHELDIVQVQGKSDTEPIPEYRQRVDEWFEHLNGLGTGGNRYFLTEEDPDREPETEYIDHNEGPVLFADAQDVLDYHDLMSGSEQQYHFGDDEEGDWQDNTIYYQNPRQLEIDERTAVGLGCDFFTNLINESDDQFSWNPQEITKFIQGLWMALHHAHSEYQGAYRGYHEDPETGETRYGWKHDEVNAKWQKVVAQIQNYIYQILAPQQQWINPDAFDANQYNLGQQKMPLIESAFDYMENLGGAPGQYRGHPTNMRFQPGMPGQYVHTPHMEERNMEVTFPGDSYYTTHFPQYFQDIGMTGLEPSPFAVPQEPQEEQRVASSEEEEQDWVPIIGQGGNEVIRGIPIGGEEGEDTGLYQWQPEPRNYGLDEALTDLRDGGYHWRVEQGDEPDMWKLQHKREPFWHDISTRDLNLRGYNVYYNDDFLPRAQTNQLDPGAPKFTLHDTTSGKEFGRIWATQRADVEGWQRPEPGALNEPHIREKFPKLWQQHWGSALMGEDHEEDGLRKDKGAEALSQAQASVRQAQEDLEYVWPTLEDVQGISESVVDPHQGYRDLGLVEGALGNTQMAHYYGQHQDIFHTAADLIFKLQRQQAIVEGNKRTATATGLMFLNENGYDTDRLLEEPLEDEFIRLVYGLSDSMEAERTGVEQLAEFLRQYCPPMQRTAGFESTDWSGYTNWDTQEVGFALEGNWGHEIYDAFGQFMRTLPRFDQFESWVIENVIGPYNKDREKEAHEWNSVPEHDRLDYSWEALKEQSPEAAGLVGDINSIFGMPNENIKDVDLNETQINLHNVNFQELYKDAAESYGLEEELADELDIGRPEWLAKTAGDLKQMPEPKCPECGKELHDNPIYGWFCGNCGYARGDDPPKEGDVIPFRPKTADADSWTEPMATTLNENVEIPGNAPGLNPGGDLPAPVLRRPCYCDVGLTMPHEWMGSCENGQRPTMEHEAAQSTNWVYLDGKVGFGQWWSDVAQKLAIELGYDETMQRYISNTIARNGIPSDLDCAVGSIRNGTPQIWVSSLDRNAVWDAVSAANQQ